MSLRRVADEALRRCDGERLCRAVALDLVAGRGASTVHLAGAGKAAGQMARGVALGIGVPIQSGLVVTKDGAFEGFAPAGVAIRFAGHPSPDPRSAAAGLALVDWLGRRRADDLVVFVLSGGASSLLAAPAAGLTLDDLRRTNDALVASGLAIDDINRVRKQLTRTSAGRLAREARARVEVLVLSDVVSGDLAQVGSGPFLADAATPAEALALLADVDGVPATVRRFLASPPPESRPPRAGDPVFTRVRHRVLASPPSLLEAAAEAAAEAGYRDIVHLAPTTESLAEVAKRLAAAAANLPPQSIVVGGGEPSLALPAEPGRGGRNQQLALCMAKSISDTRLRFLALGSDGSDGPTDAAGAVVDGASWARLKAIGDPDDALARADAYPLLDAAGLLLRTGPTGTNLCDLHLLATE